MSAVTCPLCEQWVRTLKPPKDLEGQEPDRIILHRRVRGAGPLCKGSGRAVPLYPPGEAS